MKTQKENPLPKKKGSRVAKENPFAKKKPPIQLQVKSKGSNARQLYNTIKEKVQAKKIKAFVWRHGSYYKILEHCTCSKPETQYDGTVTIDEYKKDILSISIKSQNESMLLGSVIYVLTQHLKPQIESIAIIFDE